MDSAWTDGEMQLPLDTDTATADLLSDLFLPTLRGASYPGRSVPVGYLTDVDLRALAGALQAHLAGVDRPGA